MDEALRGRLDTLVQNNPVVVFMKGTRTAPECGFSARVVEALDALLPNYATVNVLADPAVREGIKEYSAWPTIPQLYIQGELVGGADIVTELYESGALAERLGASESPAPIPAVSITPAAVQALKAALEGDDWIKLEINAAFENELTLGPPGPQDLRLEIDGVRLCLSRSSVRRADGVVIDYVQTGESGAFRINNPNEPPRVRSITVRELKGKLDRQESLLLFDVRPEGERALALIEHARILDEAAQDYISTLPKTTPLYFHCHHGGRSHSAAAHFLAQGFSEIYNVLGGVDAWAVEIDPRVARY